jgi:succinate dehydrogenase (ubiquinone) iron-sulfur subunit
VDSRDQYTDERLEQLCKECIIVIETEMKLDECQNIGMCSVTCPKGLDPQKALQHLMVLVKDFQERKTVSDAL